jgi:hypothetical protein
MSIPIDKIRSDLSIVHEHYHVTDAGIRTFLDSLINGIAKHWGDKPEQSLWYSPWKHQDQQEPYEKFSNKNAKLEEDKLLGYLSTQFNSIKDFTEKISKRKKTKLDFLNIKLRDYKKVVHIIQNPTLLKNPVETQANSLIAQELLNKNYVQIWYIHDFLEDSPARQRLREFIKTVAGSDTEEEYGENGAGIAWRLSPNIFYITINKAAIEALKGFLPFEPYDLRKYIFYLPDPVDIDAFKIIPSFKQNGATLDDRLDSFCSSHQQEGYSFDRDADIIIASEVARERKNTGEQLLILNMLNKALKRNKRKFQLLVTMIPSEGSDIERICKFQEYVRVNNLPVVMGFGKEIISRGSDRTNGKFTITDLWSHPRAYMVISTSVKEGFGLNFVNPAIATMENQYTLTTVGRKLTDIWGDYLAVGMTMPDDAFYDAIIIDEDLFHEDLKGAAIKQNNIDCSKLTRKYNTISYDYTIQLGKDFCYYSADEQILIMDIIDYSKLAGRLDQFIGFISDKNKMNRTAEKNSAAIIKNLSLESYITKLKHLIQHTFNLKQKRQSEGETPLMIRNNTKLIEFFQRKELRNN